MALFNPDTASILRKTVKNKLIKLKQTSLGTVPMILMNATKICDGMFLFEKHKLLCQRLAIYIISLNKLSKPTAEFFLFARDYYLPNSMKHLERKSRSMIGLLQIRESKGD